MRIPESFHGKLLTISIPGKDITGTVTKSFVDADNPTVDMYVVDKPIMIMMGRTPQGQLVASPQTLDPIGEVMEIYLSSGAVSAFWETRPEATKLYGEFQVQLSARQSDLILPPKSKLVL